MVQNNQKSVRSSMNKTQVRAKKSTVKWIVIILVLAVAVIAGAQAAFKLVNSSAGSQTEAINTYVAKKDDLIVTVTESGSLKAQNTIELKSEVEGRATIVSIVPAGTYITKEDVENGRILVELDSSRLEEDLATRQVDIAGSEASYADANEGYNIQLKQNESDITAAELAVKFALMDLKKQLGGDLAERFISNIAGQSVADYNIAALLDDPKLGGAASQKLGELDDQIKYNESQVAQAELKLEGTQKLYDANYVADLELIGDKLSMQRLQIQQAQGSIAMELFRLYDFPKETEKLLSDYYEAIRELERTEARARSTKAQAWAKLQSAEASLKLRKDRLEKLKQQVKACVMRAPAPGMVIYGSGGGDMYRRMRRGPIDEGEEVYEGQTIISLPDTAEMVVVVGVHESSIIRVNPGQRAEIVVDAFLDKKFTGQVIKVAQLPDEQRGWLSPDLKIYNIEVAIEGSYDFLKPGMSARVEVLVEHLRDTLLVPVQAVVNRADSKVCYLFTPQGPQLKEVQAGAFNDAFIQITAGLNSGDQVMLNPPRIIESGKKLEPKAISKSFEAQDSLQQPQIAQRAQQPQQQQRQQPDLSQMELTDEMINRIMQMMAQSNPEKHKELEKLRAEDLEKFKAELGKEMQNQMRRFRQGQAGQGQAGQGGRENRERGAGRERERNDSSN